METNPAVCDCSEYGDDILFALEEFEDVLLSEETAVRCLRISKTGSGTHSPFKASILTFDQVTGSNSICSPFGWGVEYEGPWRNTYGMVYVENRTGEYYF